MKKNLFIFLMIGILISSFSRLSFAMMCGDHSEQKQMAQTHTEHEQGATETVKQVVSKEAVNVGNKICPVSGEKIDEKTKATYEYEGKIYNFCCTACIEEFKKEPEKYIKKILDEAQTKSDTENRTEKIMMKQSKAQDTIHQERRGDK